MIFSFNFRADKRSFQQRRRDPCCARANKRIENKITFLGCGSYHSLGKRDGELAGMNRLFDMIRFDVGNIPDISWSPHTSDGFFPLGFPLNSPRFSPL